MSRNAKIRNVGPKSAAWLRQVGVRSLEDLRVLGVVGTFMKVRRAGFRPSLNLLYALEGAVLDCHWQDVPDDRRGELLLAVDAAESLHTAATARAVGAVTEHHPVTASDEDPGFLEPADHDALDAAAATDGD
jgi:hypothetical protein